MGAKAISGRSGKQGRVFYHNSGGGIDLEICVEEWRLQEMVQEFDITNSCSAGKEEYGYGTKHVEFTLRFTLDTTQHPLDDPPAFIVGQELTAMDIYLYEHVASGSIGLGSGEFWKITSPVVTGLNITNPASGKVNYEISFKSGAVYTRPTESIGSVA